ncbi:Cytidylate kinase [Blautia producta]|uniref:Cytidylate kinase n=1 Tax=Blautia producta TaxID=33035 RepID=A0A4V0Z805_9FIRM|nr:(d)CMP kinase [Blautia producta]QBE98618.1 Cytidylate kinase [Blautia producta]
MAFNIAIDGPAGAGKSTIARALAKRLSYIYVDTGAMYRAMALYLLRENISADDSGRIEKACESVDISIIHEDGVQKVLLNGEDVSSLIRSEEVGNMASASAQNGRIREKLVELQRQLAAKTDVVMDGRDIGTCVLPNADVKIYLTASVHTRAVRRFKEYLEKGMEADLAQIEADIEKRDHQDMNREISPLKKAEDAVLLDSSDMTIGEVLDAMTAVCGKKKS